MNNEYDVVVVGGGHAGVEAAHAVYRNGLNCALVSFSYSSIGQMSCNPAIGGLGKSHLVREVDAMGGIMAKATDLSGIQYRTLNTRKGNAVQALRVQCDRDLYKKGIQNILKQTNIDIIEGEVVDLISNTDSVFGVVLSDGREIKGKKTILTTGTFLNGIMYTGQNKINGGRVGEEASIPLSKKLYSLNLPMGRLKTGTPARIKMSSLDLSKMEEQKGEIPTPWMAISGQPKRHQTQLSCYITRTNKNTHAIIKKNIHLSAMYSGNISGIGPRYCPSIEDKVFKFGNKDSHQIFIEPEGVHKDLVYPNGISTSLPKEAQKDFIYSILGMENSVIEEFGYAVEYDFVDPRSIKPSMETKFFNDFYLAGQINGTTGYEEAACQGLIAGINAHQKVMRKDEFILTRSDAYIGVLIDDLITKGTEEPYRMFTSRAEYRLLLRQDNADIRLTKKGYDLGLACSDRYKKLNTKKDQTESLIKFLKKQNIEPKKINKVLKDKNSAEVSQKRKLFSFLSRPHIKFRDLLISKELQNYLKESKVSKEAIEQAEIIIKYGGYLEKEAEAAKKLSKLEDIKIPQDFNYQKLHSISTEGKEKLTEIKPRSIGQASRISGVSPSDINILLIYMGR